MAKPMDEDVATPSPCHVLPKDLPNAVKHLDDEELDRLIAVALGEAKRRGRSSATNKPSAKRQPEAVAVSLTRGQVNAVHAAFKAGIKPSLIARQFGISQSDVRRVLASRDQPG
jgi:DNA invertase Pin-like site-specific DNA recombinase